jgi:trk system potassium uptake protein TrkA
MNIHIAGGGRVGFHLARLLSAEKHDVTVIEPDHNRIEQVDFALDVSTAEGNAASVMLLSEIGVGAADLFISVTGSDELNLVCAATAKGLGCQQVLARVDDAAYLESNILYESILGIDYLLSPNALTALEITKFVESPGMVAAEVFGRGLVQVRQMRIAKTPTANGKTLKDVELPPNVLLGMITRNGDAIVPHGGSVIEHGDLVTLVGKREQMDAVQDLFQAEEAKPERIMIMGGGNIGLHLAQMLEKRNKTVKVFDLDRKRCNYLAAQLTKTKVVCRDASARVSLEQEHVADCDVFVATTHDDERNIMGCVLAKEVGAPRTVAVVHQPDFAPLVGKLGIDHAVTPRAGLANRVLRLVHQATSISSHILEEGQVEIVEYEVSEDSPATGERLRDLTMPQGALVATILRGNQVIVPRGNDVIQHGDSVILFVTPETITAAKKLFAR